ncbi:hypothetical protein BASA61_001650 [Batrachochytrium salamandrivorans]|nr:hypothetical protein BASA61_001650 [Batrachochytrium salamandrivorans]
MKPTTTIAVLCLVVAGASAMNLPWNHKSDSSDAAGSSKSSKHRGLKSAWSGLKKAFRPCGRRSKSCAQFEMAAYYHKTAVYELDIFKRGTGDTIFGKMTKRPSLEDQDCKELGIELKRLLANDALPDLTESLKESGYVFSQQNPPSTQ